MASNSTRGKSSPRSRRSTSSRRGKPSPARPSSSAGKSSRSRSRSAEPRRAQERSSRSRSRSAGPGARTRAKNNPRGIPASGPAARNATAAGQFGTDDHLAARGAGLSNATSSLSDQSSLATTTYRSADRRDDDDDGDTLTSRLTSVTELPEHVTDGGAAPKKRQRKRIGKARQFTRTKSKSNTAMSASSSVSAVIKRFGPRKQGLTLDPRDRLDTLAHLDSTDHRPAVHVDVCASPTSTSSVAAIKEKVRELLEKHGSISLMAGTLIEKFEDPYLEKNVISISITECDIDGADKRSKYVDVKDVKLFLHVYQLHKDGPSAEELEGEEDMSAANHWLLPSVEYNGLWETLVFDNTIKKQLLHYASTTLLFSIKNVNNNIITWNRVVLLHGPPGTGKTSLCKALAQKLCIRLSGRFRYGQLVEINSHGLFSKWFSESGKLVVKMFQKIKEITNDPEALVCILIDEVESLTVARHSAVRK